MAQSLSSLARARNHARALACVRATHLRCVIKSFTAGTSSFSSLSFCFSCSSAFMLYSAKLSTKGEAAMKLAALVSIGLLGTSAWIFFRAIHEEVLP
jgi:hypothetical protein